MSANPELYSLERDFFKDTVVSFHTQESLDAFAQAGDPSYLPIVPDLNEPLLVHLYENGNSVFQDD
jgi:hypothetical protein